MIKAPVETEDYLLSFEQYNTTENLENFSGLVIPSGIFESFDRHRNSFEPYTTCKSDTHRMAEIEKQVFNAVKQGSWVCFLLRSLDNGHEDKWWDTDLAKKLTNQMFAYVHGHDPIPHVESKSDEFRDFFRMHGIAQATMSRPRHESATRVLATSSNGEAIFAAEVGSNVFFLPFKSISRSSIKDIVALVESAVRSVVAYKRRNDLYLPAWIESIGFKREAVVAKKSHSRPTGLIRFSSIARCHGC